MNTNPTKPLYYHYMPSDAMYQLPQRGLPRIERNEHYRIAQAATLYHKLNPAEKLHRRFTTFLPAPSGKSLTAAKQIDIIQKLQRKLIAHLVERLKEEQEFLSKVTKLQTKISSKINQSNKKKKEYNKTQNNAKRVQLAHEYGKLNSEVEEIIKRDIPKLNTKEELFKKNYTLQQSIRNFYTRNLQNHLMFGNSKKAVQKRHKAIWKLAESLHKQEKKLYNNAVKVFQDTPGAEAKLRKNNAYKSKLTLPRSSTNPKLYSLPIKLTHPTGNRKSLKNIRREYRELQQQKMAMNVSNTTPVNAAKNGNTTTRREILRYITNTGNNGNNGTYALEF